MRMFMATLVTAALVAVFSIVPAQAYEWLPETKEVPPEVSDVPLWQAYRLTERGEASAWPACTDFLRAKDLAGVYSTANCALSVSALSDIRPDAMNRVTMNAVLWGPSLENDRAAILKRRRERGAEAGDAELVLDAELLRELLGLVERVDANENAVNALGDEVGEHAASIDTLDGRVADVEDEVEGLRGGLSEMQERIDEELEGKADASALAALEDEIGEVRAGLGDVYRLRGRVDELDTRFGDLERLPAPASVNVEVPGNTWLDGVHTLLIGGLMLATLLLYWLFFRRRKEQPQEEAQPETEKDGEEPLVLRTDPEKLNARVATLATRVGELEGAVEETRAIAEEARNDALLALEVVCSGTRIDRGLPSQEELDLMQPGDMIKLRFSLGLDGPGEPLRRTVVIERRESSYGIRGLSDREFVTFNGTERSVRKVLGRAFRRDLENPGSVIIGVGSNSNQKVAA